MIDLIVEFKACHNELSTFFMNTYQLVTIYLQIEKMSFLLRQIYDNYGVRGNKIQNKYKKMMLKSVEFI